MTFEDAMFVNVVLLHLLEGRPGRATIGPDERPALSAAQRLAEAAADVLSGPDVVAVVSPFPLDALDVLRLWTGSSQWSRDPEIRAGILAQRRKQRAAIAAACPDRAVERPARAFLGALTEARTLVRRLAHGLEEDVETYERALDVIGRLSKIIEAIDQPPPAHVHTRECYDDAGPGVGGVSLICDSPAVRVDALRYDDPAVNVAPPADSPAGRIAWAEDALGALVAAIEDHGHAPTLVELRLVHDQLRAALDEMGDDDGRPDRRGRARYVVRSPGGRVWSVADIETLGHVAAAISYDEQNGSEHPIERDGRPWARLIVRDAARWAVRLADGREILSSATGPEPDGA